MLLRLPHPHPARAIAAACAIALPVAAPLALAPTAEALDQTPTVASMEEFAGRNVFTTAASDGERRFFLTDDRGSVTHASSTERLPWKVTVDTTLDGPRVDAAKAEGAKGLVTVRVRVTPDRTAPADAQAYARQLRTFATFAIPTASCTDISADRGVSLTKSGANTVVAATVAPGQPLDFTVYAQATKFSMTPVTVAALDAADAGAYADGLRTLASRSTTLAAGVGDGASRPSGTARSYASLIAQLTTLRDRERALAKSTLETRTAAHEQAFRAYMAAYVGSYTTHLSGSIGTKTQLGALMGTAGELKGDTPLASAVTGLASAVNSVSDAHQHTGAADEVDRIIARIKRQGTQGLAEALKQTAGEETREGAKQYSSGQSQLSSAMIPYSMAYTDAYTAGLNDLCGGDVSAAAAHEQAAIAATNAAESTDATLKADKASVDAAMATLAAAREHTGAGSAAKQILLRFGGQFGASASGTSTAAGGDVQPINQIQPAQSRSPIARAAYDAWYAHSIGGAAEMKRAGDRRRADARGEGAGGVRRRGDGLARRRQLGERRRGRGEVLGVGDQIAGRRVGVVLGVRIDLRVRQVGDVRVRE
ncbi:MAG: tubuliform spidroin [Bifidobacterium sp.]|nr:tubuliform spidroin [Bifidobacterium sp.]